MQTTSIPTLLAETLGFDPSALGVGHLQRGILRRMSALGLDNEAEYAQRAKHSHVERQALVEELVVTETWFFRDVRPFEFLRRHAEAWLEAPERPPLRVLSVPCSSGEEPYSIALTLLERGLSSPRFQIEAVDISVRALELARQGVYSSKAIRELSPKQRERFFRPNARGFELIEAVRQTVRFRQGNLLEPGFFEAEPPFDVVFCRNLLIYLTAPARRQAVSSLERLLAPGGLLFVGYAETGTMLDGPFSLVPDRGAFAFRRRDTPVGPKVEAGDPKVKRPMSPEGSVGAGVPLRVPSPMPQRSWNAQESPGPSPLALGPEDLLNEAAGLADQGRYDEAIASCERLLRQNGPTATVYYLLGMIQQATGQLEPAESSLTKAVYLDGQHEDALLALSLLAQRRGDPSTAGRFRRRAERARILKTSSSLS